jgi:catechol 2,3-dioxygenase-like lactoylglutathione lyase family enzyme
MAGFRVGLDHVHLTVPDRPAAVEWYRRHLGFEPVEALDLWRRVGGPIQISADGGQTTLALFEPAPEERWDHPTADLAFSVDADAFTAFARSLPGELQAPTGEPLQPNDVVDFDLCFAYDFVDPWGNRLELNCFDHAAVRAALVDTDGITPDRKWPEGAGTST